MSERFRTTSSQIAQLMTPIEDPQHLWRADELSAIWRHQLAADLEADLGGLAEPLATQWRTLSTADDMQAKAFGDLLFHSAPPMALLELVKQFGKTHSTHPESLLPREISMALYYSAIAAALTRHHRRISSLPDDALHEGLRQVSRFSWLDQNTRGLLREAESVV